MRPLQIVTIPKNPYPGTQSVQRALALLNMFTDERPSWRLSELATAVHLNKTTTYRLLTALEQAGMVARKPENERYVLGPQIMTLGGRALRANDLRSVAKPELEQLAAHTGDTATLELLSGQEMLIIDEVIGEHLTSSVQSLGTRWPLYATSTGKALLAYLPTARAAALLPIPLTPITPHTITDWDQLQQALTAVRQRGYAINNEELEIGLIVVGAPLFNHDGRAVAAISLGAPAIRLTDARLPAVGEMVRTAAARISARLGFEA